MILLMLKILMIGLMSGDMKTIIIFVLIFLLSGCAVLRPKQKDVYMVTVDDCIECNCNLLYSSLKEKWFCDCGGVVVGVQEDILFLEQGESLADYIKRFMTNKRMAWKFSGFNLRKEAAKRYWFLFNECMQ